MDIDDANEALATGVLDDDDCKENGFIFNGEGYYDVEGIWHDPDVDGE